MRRNSIPLVDATLQPAWATLATVLSWKEKAMFQEHLDSGLRFVPGRPFSKRVRRGLSIQCDPSTHCWALTKKLWTLAAGLKLQ